MDANQKRGVLRLANAKICESSSRRRRKFLVVERKREDGTIIAIALLLFASTASFRFPPPLSTARSSGLAIDDNENARG